jgi:hypothetical protein
MLRITLMAKPLHRTYSRQNLEAVGLLAQMIRVGRIDRKMSAQELGTPVTSCWPRSFGAVFEILRKTFANYLGGLPLTSCAGTPMITHATMPLSGMERICVSRLLMMCVRSLVGVKKPVRGCGLLTLTTEASWPCVCRRHRSSFFQIRRREPLFCSKWMASEHIGTMCAMRAHLLS